MKLSISFWFSNNKHKSRLILLKWISSPSWLKNPHIKIDPIFLISKFSSPYLMHFEYLNFFENRNAFTRLHAIQPALFNSTPVRPSSFIPFFIFLSWTPYVSCKRCSSCCQPLSRPLSPQHVCRVHIIALTPRSVCKKSSQRVVVAVCAPWYFKESLMTQKGNLK